jgi:glutathione S-transferase
VGYALLLADHLKLLETASPAICAYWARLKGRPAFQAAKRVQKAELSEILP